MSTMTKPKKITVKYIDSKATTQVKKDADIKKALEAKQDAADDACPFC
jgi:hypothetical protein